MPLETCQMLSIVCSEKWGHGYGKLHRLDGQPYKTEKGAFRNHPCTVWAQRHFYWLIRHGLALCDEYAHRYKKTHSCRYTLNAALQIFPKDSYEPYWAYEFVRAMTDEFKHDTSINTFDAYKNYISSKPWVTSNYIRDPSRKPDWVL